MLFNKIRRNRGESSKKKKNELNVVTEVSQEFDSASLHMVPSKEISDRNARSGRRSIRCPKDDSTIEEIEDGGVGHDDNYDIRPQSSADDQKETSQLKNEKIHRPIIDDSNDMRSLLAKARGGYARGSEKKSGDSSWTSKSAFTSTKSMKSLQSMPSLTSIQSDVVDEVSHTSGITFNTASFSSSNGSNVQLFSLQECDSTPQKNREGRVIETLTPAPIKTDTVKLDDQEKKRWGARADLDALILIRSMKRATNQEEQSDIGRSKSLDSMVHESESRRGRRGAPETRSVMRHKSIDSAPTLVRRQPSLRCFASDCRGSQGYRSDLPPSLAIRQTSSNKLI